MREQRHRERMEEERLRPPSPPPVQHYTEHEAQTVVEKIKADESFPKAVQVSYYRLIVGAQKAISSSNSSASDYHIAYTYHSTKRVAADCPSEMIKII